MNFETGSHYPLSLDGLPNGWRCGYVGDFSSRIEPGFASGEHNKDGSGVPHLRPMNIDRDGRVDLTVVKYVAAEKDARRLMMGDVLFNNTNSPELVGKTAVVNATGDFAFSNHMTRIRFHGDVLPKFAALQLHFLWMRGYFKYNCVKHVNQASVSSRTLARSVPFIWAPTDQQQRIVAEIDKQFSRLDEAVANLQRVKANLKRYKASVLKAAVEGRLVETEASLARREGRGYETGEQLLQRILVAGRSQSAGRGKHKEPIAHDPSDLPHVPEGWAWCSVDAVCAETLIGLDRARDQQRTEAVGAPYVKMNNVTMDGDVLTDDLVYVDASDEERARFNLASGDLLFNTRNSVELVGKVGIVRKVPAGVVFNNNLMRVRTPDGISSVFLGYQMCAHGFRQRMGKVKKATTSVAAVYQKDLLPLAVALPPMDEQLRIVAEVDRQLSIIREVEAEVDTNLQRAQALRQATLAKAFLSPLPGQLSVATVL